MVLSDEVLRNIVFETDSIATALRKIGAPNHWRTLFVLDAQERVVGSISDGDIRRGLLRGLSPENNCGAFAHREFGAGSREVDYNLVPTAVFSQPNVGTVGYTEEEARREFGDVTIYQSDFKPMKHTLSGRDERSLMKLVVDSNNDRVLGLHMVGPDAGEILQGMAIALRMGATKADFDRTVGIHPTAAEELVTMREPLGT